jgi:hypothetical protein
MKSEVTLREAFEAILGKLDDIRSIAQECHEELKDDPLINTLIAFQSLVGLAQPDTGMGTYISSQPIKAAIQQLEARAGHGVV